MAGNINKARENAGLAATNFQDAVRGLELGSNPVLRKMVYDMVQAQTRTGRVGAFYDKLQCGIHNGLLNEPVALICGHTFCRGCITGHPCPTCGRSSDPLPAVNEAISGLISRITPPAYSAYPSAPLVGSGKTRRQTRKYRSRRH